VAAQTLSDIALYLPPEKVVTPLLQWAEPAVKGLYTQLLLFAPFQFFVLILYLILIPLLFLGTDLKAQQAAYTALAVIAEGCAEHIRTKYLSAFVQCCVLGIRHPTAHVRNAG
jgi:hypothetical protein